MYSHGGLEMNSLFRLDHPMGGAAAEDSKTSFENETESLYLTQLDSQHEIAPAMSSAWNSDLCGSLVHQQPRVGFPCKISPRVFGWFLFTPNTIHDYQS